MAIIDCYSESWYLADQMLADLPPPCQVVILDAYSESSYLADQVLTDLPPFPSNDNFTDSCSESSCLIPTLRAHIRQTRCWQMDPPTPLAIFRDSYSDSSYFSDQAFCRPGVLRERPFTREGNFLVVLLCATSCWLCLLIAGPEVHKAGPKHIYVVWTIVEIYSRNM